MKRQYPKRQATPEDVQAVRSLSNYRLTAYNTKVIKAGSALRVTRYLTKQQYKTWIPKTTTGGTHKDKPYISYPFRERRGYSVRRAKDKLIDTTRANIKVYPDMKFKFQSRFIRLSFAPGNIPTSRKQMTRWLQQFQLRYTKRFGQSLKYEWVDELGEETDRLHIHILVFSAPWLDSSIWDSLWKKGQTYTMTPYDEGAGGYMGKYIGKDRSHLLSGMRTYSVSRGLIKPSEVYEASNIKPLLQSAVDKSYVVLELGSAENEHRGKVIYELWLPPKPS